MGHERVQILLLGFRRRPAFDGVQPHTAELMWVSCPQSIDKRMTHDRPHLQLRTQIILSMLGVFPLDGYSVVRLSVCFG